MLKLLSLTKNQQLSLQSNQYLKDINLYLTRNLALFKQKSITCFTQKLLQSSNSLPSDKESLCDIFSTHLADYLSVEDLRMLSQLDTP